MKRESNESSPEIDQHPPVADFAVNKNLSVVDIPILERYQLIETASALAKLSVIAGRLHQAFTQVIVLQKYHRHEVEE